MNIATASFVNSFVKNMLLLDKDAKDLIPFAGEIFFDQDSCKVKIGDGKTSINDLPWVKFEIDSAKEESNLSRTARMFIENNIELIENNDYDTLYSLIATPALAQEVTRALLKADLNPKPYLSTIPQSIEYILDPTEDWSEDLSRLYTKREIDQKLDNLTNKIYAALSIPQNIIKVSN